MTAKEYQLLSYLKSIGIEKISKPQKEEVFKLIDECGSLDIAKRRLEVLYQLNTVLVKSYSRVSIANMMKINETIDKDLLIDLMMILYELKSENASSEFIKQAFKESVADVIVNNKVANVRVKKVIGDEFDKVAQIKNVLYTGMIDEKQAEQLFENCKRRSKHFLRECDAQNLENIITCLKQNYSLTNEQIVGISTKCATLFSMSSAAKIQNIDITIREFKNFICNSLKGNKDYKKGEILLAREFQDILLDSPSLFTGSADFINDSVSFLMGEKKIVISDINGNIKELHGNFNPLQLAKIYDHSITSLNVSTTKIGEVATCLNNAYYRCYGNELDLDTIINGKNFPSIIQLRHEDYISSGKIGTIFNLLKDFVSAKDMKNLLENNFSFLIAEIDEVANSLQKAILTSDNQQDLKSNVLHSIKTHFGRYEGINKDIERSPGISVGGLKKVEISEVEEEKLVSILSKLHTNKEDIDTWKSKWNNEEKEMKELEIQIELEAISEELDTIKELAKGGHGNIAKYEEENDIVISLLSELIERKDRIITNNKLSKANEKLLANVKYKIIVVESMINQNIDSVINYYNENIQELRNHLSQEKQKRAKYDEDFKEYSNRIEKLQEEGISEESISKAKHTLNEINEIIDDVGKRTAKYFQLEKEVKTNIEKFAQALTDKEYYKFVEEQLGEEVPQRHKNNEYMYMLFAKILIKEDLFKPADVNKIDEYPCGDNDIEYDEYRRLLPNHIRKITDAIYNRLKNNIEDNKISNSKVAKRIKELGLKHEESDSLSKGMSILTNQVTKLKEKITYESGRITVCNNRLKALVEMNVDQIDENIIELEKEINDFLLIIDKNQNLKIKI